MPRQLDHVLLFHLLQQAADHLAAGVEVGRDFLMRDPQFFAVVSRKLLVEVKDQTLVQRPKRHLVDDLKGLFEPRPVGLQHEVVPIGKILHQPVHVLDRQGERLHVLLGETLDDRGLPLCRANHAQRAGRARIEVVQEMLPAVTPLPVQFRAAAEQENGGAEVLACSHHRLASGEPHELAARGEDFAEIAAETREDLGEPFRQDHLGAVEGSLCLVEGGHGGGGSVQDLVYRAGQIMVLRRHHIPGIMRIELQTHVIVGVVNRRMVVHLLRDKGHAGQKRESLLEIRKPELPNQSIVALLPHAG